MFYWLIQLSDYKCLITCECPIITFREIVMLVVIRLIDR